MTLKGAIAFGIAGWSIIVLSYAILMGHLPHNWNGLIGQLAGWSEVALAPLCSPYLFYRAIGEIKDVNARGS